MKHGKEIQPGDVIRTNVPYSKWHGQVESLEPHKSWEGWQVAHFRDARSMSIGPDEIFYVK